MTTLALQRQLQGAAFRSHSGVPCVSHDNLLPQTLAGSRDPPPRPAQAPGGLPHRGHGYGRPRLLHLHPRRVRERAQRSHAGPRGGVQGSIPSHPPRNVCFPSSNVVPPSHPQPFLLSPSAPDTHPSGWLPREERLRQRHRLRHQHRLRGRRLHLRRGDGAARVARGQAGQAQAKGAPWGKLNRPLSNAA